MKFIFSHNREKLYDTIFDALIQEMRQNPKVLLGLATGATFEPVYQRWIERGSPNEFSDMHTVNLDEYYPIKRQASQSFYTYMKTRVFDPLGLDPTHTHLLDGEAEDAEAECMAFEARIIALGGIGIQLLGIGRNSHIGFNEPAEAFEPKTHRTTLSMATLRDNGVYFQSPESMPKEALTMGIGTIMSARKILLLVCGASKQEALKALVFGKMTPQCPASILQVHPDCTVLIDEEAGKYLDWSTGTIL